VPSLESYTQLAQGLEICIALMISHSIVRPSPDNVGISDSDTSGVVSHPAIDAFYAELTAKHPEIDTIPEEKIDDRDYCPWSCKLDHSPGHVIMSCVWPKATYVHQLVQELASKHGLAVYDPQSDEVTYPDGSTGGKAKNGHEP
jgi:hypothetical protein